MKTPILIALTALCLTASIAHAQTAANKSEGVQLKDIPDIGPLFRSSPRTLADQSLFGPTMPPRPRLPPTNSVSLKISVLPTPKGEVFQLEAAGQSRAAILKKITDVMGARAVIDPQLEKKFVITQVFRGLSWDDLLSSVNYGVEMVKSPSGTYFFADKPFDLASAEPFNYDLQTRDFADRESKLRADPRFDPFVFPRGGLDPKDRLGRPIEPQPHWEQREFNGHEFYYIPAPSNERLPEAEAPQ